MKLLKRSRDYFKKGWIFIEESMGRNRKTLLIMRLQLQIHRCYKLKKIHFQINEGILFRGTTTHHGVEPSNDPHTKRYLVGFQYIKADSDEAELPTLCNQLRGTSILTILIVKSF
jgi:hypothetical protein